jgi:CHAT domain-containing protein
MVAVQLGTSALVGPAATVAQVESALPEARYVHLATHGVLDAQNPYRSYLSMSDGRLEAWKLLRDTARAELIVLSACNTKLGPQRILKQVSSDEDSITGLVSYAGARRILASLWGASDEASSVLMAGFYRELAQNPLEPALALQRAKIVVKSQGFEAYQYANFVLSVRDPSAIRVMR